MPVYMVIEIEILDKDTYAEYVKKAPATVHQYGGRYLARSSEVTPLAGDWRPQRLILLEFESAEGLRRWLDSPEYRAVAPLRELSTRTKSVMVEGCSEPQ